MTTAQLRALRELEKGSGQQPKRVTATILKDRYDFIVEVRPGRYRLTAQGKHYLARQRYDEAMAEVRKASLPQHEEGREGWRRAFDRQQRIHLWLRLHSDLEWPWLGRVYDAVDCILRDMEWPATEFMTANAREACWLHAEAAVHAIESLEDAEARARAHGGSVVIEYGAKNKLPRRLRRRRALETADDEGLVSLATYREKVGPRELA